MTALRNYQRLESIGLWRRAPDEQRREVVVSIGNATLTLSDSADRVLAHWSLAALERINPGSEPAEYRPGTDATDKLEIADAEMVNAVETICRAVARQRPHPGRLRLMLLIAGLLAIAAAALFWLPEAMVRAAATVPEAKRQEIGTRLFTGIRRVSGAPCATPDGSAALAVLQARFRPGRPGRILVLRSGVRKAAHLPGGIILLNRALVEDYEDPDVVAGYVLAEDLLADKIDPLQRLLRARGFLTGLRLLTTGEVTSADLARHAEELLTAPPQPVSDAALLSRFRQAGLPSSPYAFAQDMSGETTLGLVEADPGRRAGAGPGLTDDQWIGLQGICEGSAF